MEGGVVPSGREDAGRDVWAVIGYRLSVFGKDEVVGPCDRLMKMDAFAVDGENPGRQLPGAS